MQLSCYYPPDMARLTLKGPGERLQELGRRAQALRKHRELTQAELSVRADVSLRSLQRFETTGHGSTELLIRIAYALSAEQRIDELFELPRAATLAEFERRRDRHRSVKRSRPNVKQTTFERPEVDLAKLRAPEDPDD